MAKVLVVDDSLSVRKVVERALLGRRMEVVCAATGSEALERIERDEPDVVVCDVLMPDKDGYEICQFVKHHPRLARTPVLLMSGIVNDEVRERAARVQSAAVLSKPFAADDLLRKLDAVLAASAPRPSPAAPTLEPPRATATSSAGSVARPPQSRRRRLTPRWPGRRAPSRRRPWPAARGSSSSSRRSKACSGPCWRIAKASCWTLPARVSSTPRSQGP
jgi:CheY-like chemotaxis protein